MLPKAADFVPAAPEVVGPPSGDRAQQWTAATPVGIGEGRFAPPPAPRVGVPRYVAPRPALPRPPKRATRRTKSRVVAYPLLIGLLAAAGLCGYRNLRETSDAVPSPIAYVKGAGIVYAPARQGYSIRLPEKPTHVTSHTTTDHKLTVHQSDLTYDHYEISVMSYDLPATTSLGQADFDMRALLGIWAGTATKIMKVTPAVDHGRPALEGIGQVPAQYPEHVHVVFGTRHLVLLAVHADDGNARVYHALVSSLRVR